MSLRMPAPETLLVKSVNWDFFITLTHAPSMDDDFYQLIKTDGSWSVYQLGKWWDQPTFEDQMSRLWRWHRKCARYLKLRPNEFCTAIRWEVGRGGREHFHVLVRILNPTKRTRASMYTIRHIWATVLHYGHCHARRADVMADDYITKLLSEYEESRYEDSRHTSVFFNDPCFRYLKRIRSAGSRVAEPVTSL